MSKVDITIYCESVEVDLHTHSVELKGVDLDDLIGSAGKDNLLEEIGWEYIQQHFSSEIDEMIQEAKDEE